MKNTAAVITVNDKGAAGLHDDTSGKNGEYASKGRVLAVCISNNVGEQKYEVDAVQLLPDHGIERDAHAGNWHRQVSLLGIESVKKVQDKMGLLLKSGDFAENILTEGLILYKLPVGTKLKIGSALTEVTQIGKECHTDCQIKEITGDCVMPREGIFVKVLEAGEVKAGDGIEVIGSDTDVNKTK